MKKIPPPLTPAKTPIPEIIQVRNVSEISVNEGKCVCFYITTDNK